VSVFLDVAVDELLSRVEGDVNRPLLLSDGKEELKARLTGIRNNRLPVYSQANITVNHSDLNTILEKLDVRK
jgi:shikimate kinase